MKDLQSYDDLMNKIDKTISTAWGIKGKICQADIDRWLGNFTGDALCSYLSNKVEAEEREKRLALFLLCNFVFYNENEVKYLTRLMYNKYIHQVFVSEGKKDVDDATINKLLDKTQFSMLGQVSESSAYLLYHFRQENDLIKNNFKENELTENIVFVDDFSITGSQAKRTYKERNIAPTKKVFMLFMIATIEALSVLKKQSISVLPCIVLDDKSKAFSDTSIAFDGYKSEIKEQAQKMCEFYGQKLVDSKDTDMTVLGYGGGGYMFGAYYNIPNNTLPIFWSNKGGWHYLFKRYDKKYVGEKNFGGQYV